MSRTRSYPRRLRSQYIQEKLIYCCSYRMYRTEASRRNQWEGGIEKETERKLRGLRELRKEGRRSHESGSEFASFARLREAGSRSAERFGPAKREDLKAREPGSLHLASLNPPEIVKRLHADEHTLALDVTLIFSNDLRTTNSVHPFRHRCDRSSGSRRIPRS